MHFVITSSLKRHLKPMLWTSTASCLLHPAKDRRRLRLFTRTIRCFSTQHLLKTSENGIEDPLDGVTIVQSKDQALKALKVLNSKRVRKRLHACDTETSGIDVRSQSPVGNGTVICVSVYCGQDVDFGNGPYLWIDNLGMSKGTLEYFKEYFEDPAILTTWHNFSFDRHVMYNMGIDVQGLGADTMHMARLVDTSSESYKLSELSAKYCPSSQKEKSFQDAFKIPKLLKNGQPGSAFHTPCTEELQSNASTRANWIKYSVQDAVATFELQKALQQMLEKTEWDGKLNMWDFYKKNWRPFGKLLTDMERKGVFVDTNYLKEIQLKAEALKVKAEEDFRSWAISVCPGAMYMNFASTSQKQQLFFAPFWGIKEGKKTELLPPSKEFVVDKKLFPPEEHGTDEKTYDGAACGSTEKTAEKTAKENKKQMYTLTGLGFPVVSTSKVTQLPSVAQSDLRRLCGDMSDSNNPKYGTAFDHMNAKGFDGHSACKGIDALLQVSSMKTMLSTFIIPLQADAASSSRIHTSININTETGRLSARRPNLQNQPALEKDVFKIRDAFRCAPGNTLIVADYGQLELRLLAHMSECKSMLEAFEKGGDFHSRTAMGMYPAIKKAVDNGEVLLEQDPSGAGQVPLLKDKYASERRKAKTLNFSIAYGKTAKGLQTDWNVSLAEAEETLRLWYADRPEVLKWQENRKKIAMKNEWTRTIMGRYRQLPEVRGGRYKGNALRGSINTPIQGGAADVVMKAMLVLAANQRFKDLGWEMVLQVHDEIICEGPEESVEEAMSIVRVCMENPFARPLLVKLVVDAKHAKSWYLAK